MRRTRLTVEPSKARAMVAVRVLLLTAAIPALPGASASGVFAQEPVRVVGAVRDLGTGEPVEGAMVRLASASDAAGELRETLTGPEGTFSFGGVAPGDYALGVRRIGYEDFSIPLEVGAGTPTPVEVGLRTRAVPLQPLNVDVEGRPPRLAETGFYDRLEEGWGTYFEPDWIETRKAGHIRLSRFLSDLQMRAPASRCERVPVYHDRRLIGLADGMGTSRSWSLNPAGRHRSPSGPPPRLLDELSVTDVGAAELYTPSTPIPLFALNDTTIACGAIILWSDWMAQVARIPQIEVDLCEPGGRPGEVALDGFVEDELTEVRLPAAHVFASYPAPGESSLKDLEVRTDSLGRYRLCDLPAGAAVEVTAAYGREMGVSALVEAADGARLRLTVKVTEPGTITGLVVNEGTGRPFGGVPILLVGTDFRAVTSTAGRFSLEGVPPGAYRIRAVCEGFEPASQEVEVTGAGQLRVMLALTPEARLAFTPRRCAT